MTGLEEGERPNGNSSCELPRVAKALKICMSTNSDPLFLLVKSDQFFGNVLIPFNCSTLCSASPLSRATRARSLSELCFPQRSKRLLSPRVEELLFSLGTPPEMFCPTSPTTIASAVTLHTRTDTIFRCAIKIVACWKNRKPSCVSFDEVSDSRSDTAT